MSKRKKNNELQRTKRIAALSLKDCVIVYLSGRGCKYLFSIKHMLPVKCTPTIDRAMHNIRWHWTVYISVICTNADGSEYIKSEEIAPSGEYFYSELAEVLNEMHSDLFRSVNGNHNPRPAWIAAPRMSTFDEKQAAEIYSII